MQVFQKKWFTLVELMVVVVILWVLGAVGMVSYTSYLWGSRDSNRLTQLSDIRSGLNVYTINKNLPTPEDKVDVLANANIVAYQWYAWEETLKLIGYSDGGIDPLDGSFFTYYLTKNKKDFQLMGFLEEESALQSAVIPQTYADDIDYSERIPTVTGKKLWALVESGTNTPIQEIPSLTSGLDIATTGTTYNAYYTDQDVISWTGSQLIQSVSNQNCNRILELWNSIGSGIYKISPTWNGVVQVYCDMETDGGGWTFLGHYDSTSNGASLAGWFFETTLGNYNPARLDDGTTYSINASDLWHREMMVTIDTSDISTAVNESKIVFYSYFANHPAFYTWPIACSWLNQWFSYKTTPSTEYVVGTYNYCTSSSWYPRNNDNSQYLSLFQTSSVWNYWWFGMWGDNTWGHDGWWYVR